MERSEQTSTKSFHVTEKRALENSRKSPTTRGRGAATVLNFTGALLVQEYIYLSPKNVILTSFAVTILLDTVCLTVFAADTNFENYATVVTTLILEHWLGQRTSTSALNLVDPTVVSTSTVMIMHI